MKPVSAKQYAPIELKLGIKSSLPRVKSALALLLALWKAHDKKSEFCYGVADGNKVKISSDSLEALTTFFGGYVENSDQFTADINKNALVASQIEALKVGFELIWKIAVFEFKDTTKSFNAEREGGVRFPKTISYTKNIDLIDFVMKQDDVACSGVLYSWICDNTVPEDYKHMESELVKILTIISEEAVYRIRVTNSDDIRFFNLGIYERFETGTESVDAHDDKEDMGSLRILHSIISDNLNAYMRKDGKSTTFNSAEDIAEFKEYIKRVDNYLTLTTINVDVVIQEQSSTENTPTIGQLDFPHNLIVFGAPGTGKSYTIDRNKAVFGDNFERVTFHPNYSYAQFVGTYKPKPLTVSSTDITYEYVPGPFLRLWEKAYKSKRDDAVPQNFLLIIEEINRANVAAVFGDVFQLLDRKEGESEYAITTTEDMREYIAKKLGDDVSDYEKITIPSNLYIWATMNSADQGVFPMDTAFKRRWTFQYLGIDEGEEIIESINVSLPNGKTIKWNTLRKAINTKLIGLKINEDRLLGPFFLSNSDLGSNAFDSAFEGKLLMYLYEDVLKHKRNSFFRGEMNTYSDVLRAYKIDGGGIFDFDLKYNEETPTDIETNNTLEE